MTGITISTTKTFERERVQYLIEELRHARLNQYETEEIIELISGLLAFYDQHSRQAEGVSALLEDDDSWQEQSLRDDAIRRATEIGDGDIERTIARAEKILAYIRDGVKVQDVED